MAKFKNLLSGLFPKSNSKLETDAAVIPRRSDEDANNKNGNPTANVPVTVPETTAEDSSPGTSALVPATVEDAEPQQLQLVNPAFTQNVVNNVQNNTLSGPQTTIGAGGVQVLHIKNSKNFQLGPSITINLGPENGNKPTTANGQIKWANLKLSDTIREMMKCEDELDTGMMDMISRHLGYEWKAFARTLDYSEGQIEAFECDNKTLAEQIYQFVLDWVRNDDNPSLGRMVELLWENKHKETVYRMKGLWKERRRATAAN